MRHFVYENLLTATVEPIGFKRKLKATVSYEPDDVELYSIIIEEDQIPILFHHFKEVEITGKDDFFSWGHDVGGG